MLEFISNNWLFLVFAGVMIVIMVKGGGCCGGHAGNRDSHGGGGCCGGDDHSHGSHTHDNSNTQSNQQIKQLVKDPICGMEVDPETAFQYTINGQSYYFCSEACRKDFVKQQQI